MKNTLLFAITLLFTASGWSRPITSLRGFSWEVVPTNPLCEVVSHPPGTVNRRGDPLKEFPKNAWCKRSDLERNLLRQDTPEFKLLSAIQAPDTVHIRMAYLSFGNERIASSLCEALQRGVRVELILDSNKTWPIEQDLKKCGENNFFFYSRGNSSGLGYAHNKVTLISSKSSSERQIIVGSGNLTLGTILTHENWHFVRAPQTSHFVSMHECLWEGMKDHGGSAKAYKKFLKDCRLKISTPPEKGIELFFIPGDGERLLANLRSEMSSSTWVKGASHRFNGRLIKDLLSQVLSAPIPLQMIFDDDLFWAEVSRKDFGLNQYAEALVVAELKRKGMEARYVQTNHVERLIHHNKFFVWGDHNQVRGAFFGAGNMTNTALTKNFENFYIVTLPEVTEEMLEYHMHLWNDLSSIPDEMPSKTTSR